MTFVIFFVISDDALHVRTIYDSTCLILRFARPSQPRPTALLPRALLTHIAAARTLARCRPPPAKNGKRDQKANAGGDCERQQT